MTEVSEKILSYIEDIYGKILQNKYLDFINSEPTQYIRTNSLKIKSDKLAQILKNNYRN